MTSRAPSRSVRLDETTSRLSVTFRRAMLIALAGLGCGTKAADVVASMDDAGVDGGAGDAAADGGREARAPDKCATTPFTPNPVDTCGDYVKYPCGLPPDLTIRGDCYFAVNDCALLCPDIHYNCRAIEGYCSDAGGEAGDEPSKVIPDEAGAVVIDCATCPGAAGRVPAGFVAAAATAPSVLGAYFAGAAALEAASVIAFQRLHEELALHGAPQTLLDGARAAERDEARHVLLMGRLARRHGGTYRRPRVDAVAPRSLETIARENVVEGCARETFGALLATWQAAHTPDHEIATTLAAIAEDETRHAALSWEIARWSAQVLGVEATARLHAAWSAALDDVALGTFGAGSAAEAFVVALEAAAAFPTRTQREALAGELRATWRDLVAPIAA